MHEMTDAELVAQSLQLCDKNRQITWAELQFSSLTSLTEAMLILTVEQNE